MGLCLTGWLIPSSSWARCHLPYRRRGYLYQDQPILQLLALDASTFFHLIIHREGDLGEVR